MKTPAKATIITGAILILLLIAALVVVMVTRPSAPERSDADDALPGARANSHVLDYVGPDGCSSHRRSG